MALYLGPSRLCLVQVVICTPARGICPLNGRTVPQGIARWRWCGGERFGNRGGELFVAVGAGCDESPQHRVQRFVGRGIRCEKFECARQVGHREGLMAAARCWPLGIDP